MFVKVPAAAVGMVLICYRTSEGLHASVAPLWAQLRRVQRVRPQACLLLVHRPLGGPAHRISYHLAGAGQQPYSRLQAQLSSVQESLVPTTST
jgi:hypothetical protein